jgi:hypothetical protein
MNDDYPQEVSEKRISDIEEKIDRMFVTIDELCKVVFTSKLLLQEQCQHEMVSDFAFDGGFEIEFSKCKVCGKVST